MCRAVGVLGPAEPNEVSLLHVLWGQRTAPQWEHPEADLIHGGAGQLAGKIAAEFGNRIQLGEPVYRIHQDADGVQVETAKARYAGRFVIVAMPPHLAGRIHYDPPMSAVRDQLTQRIPMGTCAKLLVTYKRPFWRDKGLAGIAIGNAQWLELCADSSDPETGVGVMASFVVGDRYRAWRPMSDADRRTAVLRDLSIYFGNEALTPCFYDEVDWPGNPWMGGGYAAYMPPGVWTSMGDALTAPVGRIHWSGTEIADRWAGFFDGAVRTEEVAAKAVHSRLVRPDPRPVA